MMRMIPLKRFSINNLLRGESLGTREGNDAMGR